MVLLLRNSTQIFTFFLPFFISTFSLVSCDSFLLDLAGTSGSSIFTDSRVKSMLTRGLAEALENELEECLRIIRDASAALRILAGIMKSEGKGPWMDDLGDLVPGGSCNFFSDCVDNCSEETEACVKKVIIYSGLFHWKF